jgi:hypothetical protein
MSKSRPNPTTTGHFLCAALLLVVPGVVGSRIPDLGDYCVAELRGDDKEAEVKKALTKIAAEGLKEAKVTEEGKKGLDKVLDTGLQQLKKDEFAPDKVRKAEANLKKLIQEILKNADKEPIDSKIIKATMGSVCPLYPFC